MRPYTHAGRMAMRPYTHAGRMAMRPYTHAGRMAMRPYIYAASFEYNRAAPPHDSVHHMHCAYPRASILPACSRIC